MKKPVLVSFLHLLMCALVLGIGLVRFALAEKVDLSAAQLRKISTHIIVGKIVAIKEKTEEQGGVAIIHYTAQVKISRVEKGAGLHKGEICDVRYWHRAQAKKPAAVVRGKNQHVIVSTGTSGHRGLPTVGNTMRVYLARNAYDGFTYQNHDGGFNVIGANGFQKLP